MKFIYILLIYGLFYIYIDILFNIYIMKKIKGICESITFNKKIIYIVFIIIVLIVLGVLINDFYNLNNDILSYCGAIFGGGMTLIGVIVTIDVQDKQRKNDLDNENFPFPMFDLAYNSDQNKKEKFDKLVTVDKVSCGHDENYNGNYLGLPMYIFNLSSVDVFNLCIRKITIEIISQKNEKKSFKYILNEYSKEMILTTIIPQNCKINIEILVPLINKDIPKYIIDNKSYYNLYLDFEYTNKHSYSHSQTIVIHCDCLSLENDIYYTNKTRYVIHSENIK